jgi:2Fe-2S ferredoxin
LEESDKPQHQPPRTVQVTYVEHNGAEHLVNVLAGMSVMEGAVWNGVPGILGDCCGDGGCATCHVYIAEPWRAQTGEKSYKERSTLRFALNVAPDSRLACQIKVEPALDGLVVRMPEKQF